MFSKVAQKVNIFWATLVKICHQKLPKIAQSGHIGGKRERNEEKEVMIRNVNNDDIKVGR